MLVEDVIERLEGAVPSLNKRIRGALELSELMARKALPQYTPAAFVMHNGLVGGTANFSTGTYLQATTEIVSVILVQRTASDVTGARGQAQLHELVNAVLMALCGWAPEPVPDDDEAGFDPVGVFVLRRGRVLQLDAGTVFYQLDFDLSQQVRVLS